MNTMEMLLTKHTLLLRSSNHFLKRVIFFSGKQQRFSDSSFTNWKAFLFLVYVFVSCPKQDILCQKKLADFLQRLKHLKIMLKQYCATFKPAEFRNFVLSRVNAFLWGYNFLIYHHSLRILGKKRTYNQWNLRKYLYLFICR